MALKKESRTVKGGFDELVSLEQKSDHDLSRNESAQPRRLNIYSTCRLRPPQTEGIVESNPTEVESKDVSLADHIDLYDTTSYRSNRSNDSGYESLLANSDNVQSEICRFESPPVETQDGESDLSFPELASYDSRSILCAKSSQDHHGGSLIEDNRDHRIDTLCGELNDESHCFLTADSSRFDMSSAKHQLVVILMREVYTKFNPRWQPKLRVHGGDQPTSPSPSQHVSSKLAQAKGKRKIQDRASPPPDGNDGERQGKRPKPLDSEDEHTLFACPFHKFDPRKYCSSSRKYHTCAGPGFASISRLR